MSAEEAYFALQAIEHKLAPGAFVPFIEANSQGLGACPVPLLPGLIEARLADPANSHFLKPAHARGSVEAVAAEMRTHGRGGLFGLPTNTPLAPMPAAVGHFQAGTPVARPSSESSVMQRMEWTARGGVKQSDQHPTANPGSLFAPPKFKK